MSADQDELTRVVDQLLEGLQKAWNAGDASGFADHFRSDADFVDVLGRFIRGRDAIGRLHQRNFATIHAGSRLHMQRLTVQQLGPGVVLAHATSSIHVPAGPLAGDSSATQTIVLDSGADAWKVRAFHNTLVREIPGVPEVDS